MSSVFTKIMNQELPGHFVYEDDQCIVIMTIEPINPGHVLVIPREEINHWVDLPEALASHLMLVSQRTAKAVQSVFPAKRIGMSIVGIEVPHVHIHLCPINGVSDMNFANACAETAEVLADHAQQLSALMQ
ncbi:MAG: HIT family protein [Pseudomonadota bacterium]